MRAWGQPSTRRRRRRLGAPRLGDRTVATLTRRPRPVASTMSVSPLSPSRRRHVRQLLTGRELTTHARVVVERSFGVGGGLELRVLEWRRVPAGARSSCSECISGGPRCCLVMPCVARSRAVRGQTADKSRTSDTLPRWLVRLPLTGTLTPSPSDGRRGRRSSRRSCDRRRCSTRCARQRRPRTATARAPRRSRFENRASP
jgi:hypothetical protein